MNRIVISLSCIALLISVEMWAQGEAIPGDLSAKIDAVVGSAYGVATAEFPCKVKTRSRPKMLRWEEVDRCLNGAADRIDWKQFSDSLKKLRASAPGVSAARFNAAVEDSLSLHAVHFEKVFTVNKNEGYLPLTNSMLKYIAPRTFEGLQVIDKFGTELGTFAGVYSYERMGGLTSANTYSLMLFQYQSPQGDIHSAADKLLLDSYGVLWKEAMPHIGFRLPFSRLDLEE